MKKLFILFLFLVANIVAQSKSEIPVLKNIVTDNAAIFTNAEFNSLQKKLKDYETKTTTQIVVLTINTLKNYTIEAYSLEVFNQNKLGQKDKDNGVLIVFSKEDKEVRIEVGYGLEHVLTDLLCHRIIYNTMIPEFKKGKNFKGIDLATTQIISFLNDPTKADQFIEETNNNNDMPLIGKILFGAFITFFLGVFIFFGFVAFKKSYKTLIEIMRGFLIGKLSFIRFIPLLFAGLFSTLSGSVFVIMPLFFVGMFYFMFNDKEIDFFTLIPDYYEIIIFAGLIIFILLPILIAIFKIKYSKNKFDFNLSKTDKKYFTKTFSSSGTHSFSSGSSGSSGGSSFSGGGGSSGGGGASGSW